MSFAEIEYRERLDSWAMSDLQSHDYYELYFLLEGERQFFFGERMFNISSPAFCIIPPFVMHKTSGGSYKRVNINISPDMLRASELDMLDEMAGACAFTLDQYGADTVISLLRAASEIEIVDRDEKLLLILSFVHTILHLVEKASLAPIDHTARLTGSRTDELMLKIAAYISDNFKDELTLDCISETFYISKNALCARFKDAMSCSVMQYLSFVRLNKAKELLATTDKSMEEISELCGYSSANYFSLIFKKNVGMSPKNYKKTK